MEFLMPETKVYAILTAGYDRKERMEGRILGEEHAMAGSFFLRKREKRYILERPCFLYNKAIKDTKPEQEGENEKGQKQNKKNLEGL